MNKIKEICLAGGCFWGVEKYFADLAGVVATNVGYANGNTQNPTYEEVCRTETGFAEAVNITYDASITNLDNILSAYYKIIDPTVLNRQGPDIGTQYRTGIYYKDETDRQIITNSLQKLQASYKEPVVVENIPLSNYYKAEEYHQSYLDKNPNGYCHIPSYIFAKST